MRGQVYAPMARTTFRSECLCPCSLPAQKTIKTFLEIREITATMTAYLFCNFIATSV